MYTLLRDVEFIKISNRTDTNVTKAYTTEALRMRLILHLPKKESNEQQRECKASRGECLTQTNSARFRLRLT